MPAVLAALTPFDPSGGQKTITNTHCTFPRSDGQANRASEMTYIVSVGRLTLLTNSLARLIGPERSA